MQTPASSTGNQAVALGTNQIVSQTPVETDVFLSLQIRMPVYVSAGDKLFEVNGAAIREVQP